MAHDPVKAQKFIARAAGVQQLMEAEIKRFGGFALLDNPQEAAAARNEAHAYLDTLLDIQQGLADFLKSPS